MVRIKQDSELMTNYVAANPIPAGEQFAVFRDEHQEAAVFAVSEDHILELIIVIDGKATKLNFGEICGAFSKDAVVQALAVTQAPDDKLDISVAVESSGSSTSSDYYLFHGIAPKDLTSAISSSNIIRGSFDSVKHIYQHNKSTLRKHDLPMVMVSFKRPDRVVSTEDLRYVLYSGQNATLSGSWDLATNPQRILDVELGTNANGEGAFVLYEGFNGGQSGPAPVYVQFRYFTGRSEGMAVQPHCPDGATCLSSYLHPDSGQTIMLVGGTNITSFTAREYTSPTGYGTVINTPDKEIMVKDLHVSQAGENLRLWYTTDADALHYYTTTAKDMTTGTVIPLLPEGQGGRVSSMLTVNSESTNPGQGGLVSSLLSVDESGNLTLLQQDSATNIWQQYPFWHATSENIMELKGYLLRMHAVPDEGDKASDMPGCWLRVSCSGVVRCSINGRHASVSPTPQWFQTDAKGVLNIMLQNDDATCNQFLADTYRALAHGSPEIPLTTPILDPSQKLVKKLAGVKDASDLRALRSPDGTHMFGDMSDDDAKAGADAIKTLVNQVHKFHQDTQRQVFATSTRMQMASFQSGQGLSAVARGVPFTELFGWGDIMDGLEGAWHWLEEKVEDVVKWGVDFVEDAAGKIWKFVVKIGGQVIKLALNTVASIVKAITWVFRKLGAVFQKIFEFFKYIFEWGDILDTADSIGAAFNASLDYGQELIDSTEMKVDSWLETMRTTIKSQLTTLQDYNYSQSGTSTESQTDKNTDQQAVAEASGNDDLEDNTKSGVAYNWSTYYFTYGGGPTNAVLHDGDDDTCSDGNALSHDSAEGTVVQMWSDLQDEIETMAKTCAAVVSDLISFFASGGRDIKGLMGKLGDDLIDGMVDSLKILADILSKALSLGISLTKTMANKTIDIPVLGWLWKTVISRGRPLSLLGLVSLLLAIPTTVLYKATLKTAPPKLKDRLTKDTFKQYTSGNADPGFVKDMQNFGLSTGSSLEMVYGEFSTLSLLADGTFEGTGLESVPIGPVAALMNVLNSAALTFDTIDGFLEWPVDKAGSEMTAVDNETVGKVAKYSKWGLTLVNLGASMVVKIVAKAKKAEQPAVKRWKGTIAALISVPMICVALTGDINSAIEAKEKTVLTVDHFVEAFLKFGKQWGYAAASWNNEVENEIMYVGLVVKQVCTYTRYALKAEDFIVGHL